MSNVAEQEPDPTMYHDPLLDKNVSWVRCKLLTSGEQRTWVVGCAICPVLEAHKQKLHPKNKIGAFKMEADKVQWQGLRDHCSNKNGDHQTAYQLYQKQAKQFLKLHENHEERPQTLDMKEEEQQQCRANWWEEEEQQQLQQRQAEPPRERRKRQTHKQWQVHLRARKDCNKARQLEMFRVQNFRSQGCLDFAIKCTKKFWGEGTSEAYFGAPVFLQDILCLALGPS